MFDSRSILDILLGGRPPQGRGQPDADTFRDLLGRLGGQPMPGPQEAPQGRWAEPPREATGRPGPAPSGDGLEDLLSEILTGGQASASDDRSGGSPKGPGGGAAGTSLQDILRDLLQGGPGGGPRPGLSRAVGEGTQGGDAGLLEVLKQVLGQATEGVRDGATRVDEATGASGHAREVLGQATGQTPEELIARLRELVARNPLAAGAALGGLGALVLGTGAGRSLATSALRLGGLALIGGLAYKAYRNYSEDKPILPGGKPAEPQPLAAAPEGSGFEAGAVSDEAARRYIRTMIAAAAADGRIDATEQQSILAGLKQAGIEGAAQQFLAAEINNPATPAELAAGVGSPQEALQVYTAARVAVDFDTGEEHAFLASLAEALGIDRDLAAQVDAAARDTA